MSVATFTQATRSGFPLGTTPEPAPASRPETPPRFLDRDRKSLRVERLIFCVWIGIITSPSRVISKFSHRRGSSDLIFRHDPQLIVSLFGSFFGKPLGAYIRLLASLQNDIARCLNIAHLPGPHSTCKVVRGIDQALPFLSRSKHHLGVGSASRSDDRIRRACVIDIESGAKSVRRRTPSQAN